MARIVLDANVIVSAAFGGTPLKALIKAFRHEVIVSPIIKKELISLPEELARKLSPDRMAKLRRHLKILPLKTRLWIPENPAKTVSLCRDPKDDAYLALCLSTEAHCLVTGDADLLSIPRQTLVSAGLERLTIVNPRKFLTLQS